MVELGRCFAQLYTAAVPSSAFGGLNASGSSDHLDGAHGTAEMALGLVSRRECDCRIVSRRRLRGLRLSFNI